MRVCVVLFTVFVAAYCRKVFTGDQVLRVNANSEEQIQLLKELENRDVLELDFWTHPVSSDLPVDIHVPYASVYAVQRFLQDNQIPFHVMIKDLQELVDKEQEDVQRSAMKSADAKSFDYAAYHKLDAIYSWMDSMVADHPNLISKVQIGFSYEKRPMYALKFSTGGSNRPAIWIDAGIHSREWVSTASALWMANKMATDFGVDPSVTSLLGQMDVYLMIVTNPDGYAYTHTYDRMWRKTRSVNPGSTCRGVDPNRNWDAGFGGPGASKNPCSESYHGPSAHSEIEVQNIVDLIKNHGNFKSFISIHAYSQLLMYPYGYTCTDIPDKAELDSVGRRAVQDLSSLYGTSYSVGSICKIIYQASGGSIDWSYKVGVKYSFAFELRDTGRYGFLLPANQIIPTASETWLALKYIMEYVRKSNVMDALGFVMGERASSLRVRQTRELIHGAHVGKPVSRTASVSMCFCNDDDEETIFSRTVSGDSSEYRINGRHVTLSRYTSELEKIGIVLKTRNCLVFQGAVESIAMMNAKERTKMFERISTSFELANEYDTKLSALQKAKEDTQYHFNRKRAAAAEKKQVFKDKTEAEKYQALVEQLSESKLQLSLFQLYHNERGVNELVESLGAKQEAVAVKKSVVEEWEQTVKAQKKEHGRLNRELQKLEKEIKSQEEILSCQRPQYIRAKVNTSHHQRKLEEERTNLLKSQKQQAKKEQGLQELETEFVELEKAWKVYEREIEEWEAQRGKDVQLEEAQLERYKELKELARKKGAVLLQKAEKIHWELKADREKLEFDKRRKNEVGANIKHAEDHLDELNKRAGKLEEYGITSHKALDELQEQEQSLAEILENGRLRMLEVNRELALVVQELQNARIDSQENRRQQKRNEILESLRRLYPDVVYGRLMDLCQPIHKKYQIAVTKVFGHYMNAIVVSSAKVARDCIQIIKSERAERETFLPIDNLDVKPLNERLREVRGAKMVVDVVACSQNAPQLKRVVQFVCGNSLVCENLKDARHVAFDGPERLKTVSLDGTLFSKSGVISGGSAHLRSKARRWEEKDMNGLKERKEQLSAELRELMKLKRKEAELHQITAQAQGIQTRLKYSNSELESMRKKSIPAYQTEISRLESELSNLKSQIEMQTSNVQLKDSEVTVLHDEVNHTEDTVFSDFCSEIGVANIREYEQDYVRQQGEIENKRMQFESQQTRLKTQLEYEQEQLNKHRRLINKIEESIKKEEDVILMLKE
ncbi:structural maintenance of chromosomes protein 1B-like, partial [Clarias magur]